MVMFEYLVQPYANHGRGEYVNGDNRISMPEEQLMVATTTFHKDHFSSQTALWFTFPRQQVHLSLVNLAVG